ncbi:MAG: hypothetical protein N2560_07040 [Ignavibacteria bacterium]|nr:hypothetical protein [Ignavibacteria bacterium]
MKNRFFITIIALLFSILEANSQLRDLAVEIGLIPTSVFGDNGASNVFTTGVKESTIGGGFFGFQNGILLKTVWVLEESNLSIPFGLEYIFYRAYHRVPYAPRVTFYFKHFIDAPTLTLGLRYNLFKLPFANVKAYAELDARGSFIGKSNYSLRIDYEALDSTEIKKVSHKNSVFRFGTGFKIGFLGEIVHPWYANMFASVSYVNLLGKNNRRGELLTPVPKYESSENPVYNFQLAVTLFYKF